MHFNTDHQSLQNHEFLQNEDRLIFRLIWAVAVGLTLLLVMAGCAAKHSATATPPHAPPPHASHLSWSPTQTP